MKTLGVVLGIVFVGLLYAGINFLLGFVGAKLANFAFGTQLTALQGMAIVFLIWLVSQMFPKRSE